MLFGNQGCECGDIGLYLRQIFQQRLVHVAIEIFHATSIFEATCLSVANSW